MLLSKQSHGTAIQFTFTLFNSSTQTETTSPNFLNMPTSRSQKRPVLARLDPSIPIAFHTPAKKINEGQDVSLFLCSKAYTDIVTFLLQLNIAMFPIRTQNNELQVWDLGNPAVQFSETITKLQSMIATLDSYIDEAPPETGPRRFGNMAFRTWYTLVETRLEKLMHEALDPEVLNFKSEDGGSVGSMEEIKAYLFGSFGSAQRLDYGTGHELSFLAFLAAIWKLGGFTSGGTGEDERAIVLGVFEP